MSPAALPLIVIGWSTPCVAASGGRLIVGRRHEIAALEPALHRAEELGALDGCGEQLLPGVGAARTDAVGEARARSSTRPRRAA